MNLVPVKLRPHLIPFFCQEFEGIEVNCDGKKVKACKISEKSSIGFMILTSLRVADRKIDPGKYFVYITFRDEELDAEIYKVVSGKNQLLEVPLSVCERINDILEDQFRIAFVYFVKGMMISNEDLLVRDAIQEFMVEYELDEYGFELETMRRLLNRGGQLRLSRMQNSKVSSRFLNFNQK